MDKQRFVEFYFPAARMAGNLYRINPVVILAQSAIESGWGESTLAQEYNNFFGLTGYGVVNAYWHGGKTDQGKNSLLFRPPHIHGLPPGRHRKQLPCSLCP